MTAALAESAPATDAAIATVTAADPAATALAAGIAHHQRALRERGLTVFRDLISPDQLAAMRRAVDRYLSFPPERNVSVDRYHGANLVAWDPAFAEIAMHPLLLGTVEGLIGDDCILSSANLGARIPGGGRQGLHRDTGIWGQSLPFMPFPVGIQTAWCLDDFTLENGATHVVPNSHNDPSVDGSGEMQVTAPAGSVIAFDCQALHAGGANHTQALRRGVLTLYIRSWLKPQTDHKRSWPAERIPTTPPALLRLLGFQRQTPVENPDGTQTFLAAPGATNFYGGALANAAGY